MTKIGDIITALPVPDDVIEVIGYDGDPWRRSAEEPGHWSCTNQFDGSGYAELTDVSAKCMLEYAPLRVVEVAASGPITLTLPEVPAGAVALIGAVRYERGDGGHPRASWRHPSGALVTLGEVLDNEAADGDGSVTVEFAPPREPRTWPKLDGHEFDSLPDAVTVDDDDHRGVWRRCSPEGVLYSDGMSGMTLAELRTLGTVTEVFGDA